MQAVVLDQYGPPDVLHLTQVPEPTAGPGQIKIAVAAAAINPADFKWRSGALRMYSDLEFPQVLGYDVAGTVCEIGAGVKGFAVGERVVGMVDHRLKGGYAEFAVVEPECCASVPESMDIALAAAIPTPGLTGLQLIEEFIRPERGQRLLITGACGSVGRFAMYAALRAGVHVVAAVREGQRLLASELSAREVIVIGEPYSGAAFDHVADTVGGADVAALCRHVKPSGRIRTVATTPIDPDGLPSVPEFVALHADAQQLAALVAAVFAGAIPLRVARRLPSSRAAEAHRLMEAGGQPGKIVLEF
jgi:NADPH:quinone reductase-like Zn-dependent oxidoreductase